MVTLPPVSWSLLSSGISSNLTTIRSSVPKNGFALPVRHPPKKKGLLLSDSYLPILDKIEEEELTNQKETLMIQGCKSGRPEDVIETMRNWTIKRYSRYLNTGSEL